MLDLFRLNGSRDATGVAIAGVGQTAYSRASGVSVLTLATEACRAAADDCGLALSAVDGIVSHNFNGDSVGTGAVATALGLPRLSYSLDISLGGQAPSLAVLQAALAVASGAARNVLVFRALNGRSGYRVGREVFPAPTAQYRYPYGMVAYAQGMAMWARRYQHETGAGDASLAAVVLAQRRYAQLNERAMRRRPLDLDGYLARPLVIDPFRPDDLTIEVDGACALLITSSQQAVQLRHRPVEIRGGAWVSGRHAGYDVSDVFGPADLTRNFTALLAEELWQSARVRPSDIEFAEIYDCFSSTVLFGLEGLGFAARGQAGAFIASGATGLAGAFPVNTNGGMLNEGYVHGMNTIAEAVVQIQRRAGARQIPRSDVAVVTSGALTDGSALVLANGER